MNNKLVIIVGSGVAETFKTALYESRLLKTFVPINNLETTSSMDFSEPIAYNARPPIPDLFEGKQFICKGKHQYREVREQEGSIIKCKWICQCGRTTK